MYHPVSFHGPGHGCPLGPSNHKVERRVADLPKEGKQTYNNIINNEDLTFYALSDSLNSPTPKTNCFSILKSMSNK
ncbi:hypothetical protein MJO28_014522 [Puccinia striiformis f. sp. tritici]|uniref:Uncharacterized protein n=3 Tax=Puccinia striiformis TaxID=27350 RepID=A0A2S4UNV8_9BASI|nr:hypothetical protein MJO28_014522 [Puccinia striiformis f. sp. tritici]POV98804.1 hypothetical protein PSTT_14189 [Puccinia striiformis]POW03425.1 hypothetical protein PSHT_11705 [Puccinia striiformis]